MNQGFTTSGAAHPPEYTIEQMDNMITALSDNGDLMNGYRVTFPIRAIYAGELAWPHTVEDLLLFNRNKLFCGWTQSNNTETIIPRYNFMVFYVSKMAVAIAFLWDERPQNTITEFKNIFDFEVSI